MLVLILIPILCSALIFGRVCYMTIDFLTYSYIIILCCGYYF